ncbi:hypothetical protein CCYA_CCYA13G3444 [Cyanidiococcus yangmingshanensis]|nr:hypothetical protein CCYA_CCYA13G3444 [Cyanidiococcus yangmingshanensis]
MFFFGTSIPWKASKSRTQAQAPWSVRSRGAQCRLQGRFVQLRARRLPAQAQPLVGTASQARMSDAARTTPDSPDDAKQLVRHMNDELENVMQGMMHLEEYALEQVVRMKDALQSDLRKLAQHEEEQPFAQKLSDQLANKESAVFEAMRRFLFYVVGLQEQTAAITNELQALQDFVSENHERVELVLETLRERGLFGSRQDVFEGEVKKKLERFDPEI